MHLGLGIFEGALDPLLPQHPGCEEHYGRQTFARRFWCRRPPISEFIAFGWQGDSRHWLHEQNGPCEVTTTVKEVGKIPNIANDY
jgi:hypothetical protein